MYVYFHIIWKKNQNVARIFLLFKEIDNFPVLSTNLYCIDPRRIWTDRVGIVGEVTTCVHLTRHNPQAARKEIGLFQARWLFYPILQKGTEAQRLPVQNPTAGNQFKELILEF